MPYNRRSIRAAALALSLCASPYGCMTAEEYAAEADDEAYGMIDSSRARILDVEENFTIEPMPTSLRQRILSGEEVETTGLTLLEILDIAAENNRDYQTSKERLYLVALALARQRFNYGWQESASVDGTITGVGGEASTQSVDSGYALTRLLGSGAVIVADIGLNLLKVVGSPDGFDAVSDFGVSVTQPLMRGFGRRIVMEPLTQAERNLVYEVRSFERFRRTFAVDVTGRVYSIVQQQDSARNELLNIEALEEVRIKNEALAEAGRQSEIQVDQARQDELSSRNTLLSVQQRLDTSFDDLNLFLGLPIDTELVFDPSILEELRARGVEDVEFTEEFVIAAGLERRLDFQTTLDQVDDAERSVTIAADALRADLGFDASVDFGSDTDRPASFAIDDATWTVGLNLDLPLERLPERNAYRASLIGLTVAQRNADEDADTIAADLRAAMREMRTTRLSYDINVDEFELAERRVEGAQLSLDAGRSETRDLLDAQEDLLDAQNDVTSALIDYTLAKLALYRDMEVLIVDEDGVRLDETVLESLPRTEP